MPRITLSGSRVAIGGASIQVPITLATTTYFYADGDSLTAGHLGSAGADYPQVLDDLHAGWTHTNGGVNGDTAQANVAAANAISGINANDGGDYRVVAYWFGINDIANLRSAAQVSADIDSFITAARAGFTGSPTPLIAGCTLIRRQGATAWEPGNALDLVRQDVNTHIKATASFDFVIDLDADSRFSNPLDTTYYNADQVHLTDAGYAAVADVADTAFAAQGIV